jgi:hypothetical protein
MRRVSLIAFCTAILFASLFAGSGTHTASAVTLSPGCASLNGLSGTDLSYTAGVMQYYQGETITVSSTEPLDDLTVAYIPNSLGILAGGSGLYTRSVSWTVPSNQSANLYVGWFNNPNGAFISVACSGASGIHFGDGRMNAYDAGETFALYCVKGAINVYAIDPISSKGSLVLTVTSTELAAVPPNPTVNTVIKSGGGATLYRLAGGKLQVNRNEPTGKVYSFIFSDCTA